MSPSRFPTSFIQQQGGVEALFQGAAKGILERGEKMGVNQAVRDALGEIRRNVIEARSTMNKGRDLFAEAGPNTTAMQAVATLDKRNKQLAVMLDEALGNLRALSTSDLSDRMKQREALEIAAAKIQFVKVYLEDSTVALPGDEQSENLIASGGANVTEADLPTEAVAAMVISTPEVDANSPDLEASQSSASALAAQAEGVGHVTEPAADPMETDPLSTSRTATPTQTPSSQRPHAPIPTRSTLAQSSFAWMLEPDQPASSTPQKPSSFDSSTKPKAANKHHKKPSGNANRERTAFLFGEVPSGSENHESILPEDIFGLQPMGKSKERGKLWDDD